MVLCIPQHSRITKASSWDYIVSYTWDSLQECYLSVEMQLVYSAAPADGAYRVSVGIFYFLSLESLRIEVYH